MERYTPNPIHIYMYAFPLLLLGAIGIGIGEQWTWFGISTMLLGFGMGVWIVINGIRREHAEYWEQLERNMKLLSKSNDPALWQAFGFIPPHTPERVLIDMSEGDNPQSHWKFLQLDIGKQRMRQLCNGVLKGLPFTEDHWCEKGVGLVSSRMFRQFRSTLLEDKLIRFTNPKNKRMGYTFTAKGHKHVLLKYADPDVIDFVTKHRQTTTTNLLSPDATSVPTLGNERT